MDEREALEIGHEILASAHLLIAQHQIVFGLIDPIWLHEFLAHADAQARPL